MTDRIIAFSILCLVFGLPLGVAALFTGELILEGTKIPLSQGKAVCIRKNQRHAVKAFHDFEYIEIHVGTSSGNEDINRITFHWDEIELSHIL